MSSPLSHLCGICDEFWDVPGASAATADFDAYVAAGQARNADFISLNQQVAGICEEPMTGIEPALSAWEAEVPKCRLIVAHSGSRAAESRGM